MELPPNFDYFEKGADGAAAIEKLIKENGDTVCQDRIGHEYILNSVKKYLFGFSHKTIIARIGQRQKKKNPEHLYSFIICDYFDLCKSININLICSRENAKDGKMLIQLAETRARELGFTKLTLFSILDDKLLRWYKSQGFKIEKEVYNPGTTELKTYLMSKNI